MWLLQSLVLWHQCSSSVLRWKLEICSWDSWEFKMLPYFFVLVFWSPAVQLKSFNSSAECVACLFHTQSRGILMAGDGTLENERVILECHRVTQLSFYNVYRKVSWRQRGEVNKKYANKQRGEDQEWMDGEWIQVKYNSRWPVWKK